MCKSPLCLKALTMNQLLILTTYDLATSKKTIAEKTWKTYQGFAKTKKIFPGSNFNPITLNSCINCIVAFAKQKKLIVDAR